MKFHIKKLNDNTITLMTESGYVLAYFSSVLEALSVCDEWYFANDREHKYEVVIDAEPEVVEYQELYAA